MEFFIQAKPIIVVLHALSAAVGLGAVVTTDTLFFRFLKDYRISRKEADTLDTISKVIWGAIFLLFITGAMLYLSAPMDYLAKSKFVAKIIIFIFIVGNGLALNTVISPYLIKLSFNEDESPSLKKTMKLRILRRIAFASGAVSMISWFSVFILGSIRSIPVTTSQALLIYLGLVCVGIAGSQVFAYLLKKHSHHGIQ
jgi:hypothetical protein